MGNARLQMVISFSEDEGKTLVAEIEAYSAATGSGKSGAVKTYLRAAMGDELAKQTVETFRKMKGFTVAALPVAREPILTVSRAHRAARS